MALAVRAAEKIGALGTLVSAASCPACYPALAGLGAAMGLGVLSGYEGLFMNTLLPAFAAVALLAHGIGWFAHRRWQRSVVGMIGPALVLAAVWLLFGYWWTPWLLYTGLAFMFAASLWDLFSPARRSRAAAPAVVRESLLKCPQCGHEKLESMPLDACQWFYECEGCKTVLRPKAGDCCVFCSYGTQRCPPMQVGNSTACCQGGPATVG